MKMQEEAKYRLDQMQMPSTWLKIIYEITWLCALLGDFGLWKFTPKPLFYDDSPDPHTTENPILIS